LDTKKHKEKKTKKTNQKKKNNKIKINFESELIMLKKTKTDKQIPQRQI